MRFDSILGYINETVKDEIFTNNNYNETVEMIKKVGLQKVDKSLLERDKFIRDFRTNMKKYHVTKELLKELEEDFNRIDSEMKEKRKSKP